MAFTKQQKTKGALGYSKALDHIRTRFEYRVLWETVGPGDTRVGFHGCIALYDSGAPSGVLYVQGYTDSSWEVAIMSPHSQIGATLDWIAANTHAATK